MSNHAHSEAFASVLRVTRILAGDFLLLRGPLLALPSTGRADGFQRLFKTFAALISA